MTKRKKRNQGGNSYRSKQDKGVFCRELGGGKYSVCVVYPRDADGKRKRSKPEIIEATSMSRAMEEGQKMKRRLLKLDESGGQIETVDTYARGWFEDECRTAGWDKLTKDRYETDLARIEKYFEGIPVEDLDSKTVKRLFAKMESDGVSDYSRGKTFKLLKRILRVAYLDEVLRRNPCDTVNISVPDRDAERHAAKLIDKDTYQAFAHKVINEPRDGRIVALYLGLALGARRGEVLALRWCDVDFDAQLIHIRHQYGKGRQLKQCKANSARSVIVDSAVMDYLNEWQKEQGEKMDARGFEQAEETPVCSDTRNFGFQHPDNFSRWRRDYFVESGLGTYERVEKYVDKYGYEREKKTGYRGADFHSLRRVFISLLVESKAVDVKTVQKLVGHSRISTTMDTYAHSVSDANAAAAAGVIGGLMND